MRILHIASFDGNFGDRVSHEGFRKLIGQVSHNNLITELEIRNFYLNMNPSVTISDFLNEHHINFDKIVIGGGGFLTQRSEYSDMASCSIIDLNKDLINKIGNKLIFYSIGYEGESSSSAELLDRMKTYLNDLKGNGCVLILRDDFGNQKHANDFKLYMDSAYHAFEFNQKNSQREALGLVLSGSVKPSPSNDLFIQKEIDKSISDERPIKFFSHTHYDYARIGGFISKYNDIKARKLFEVIPASNKGIKLKAVFSKYKKCEILYSERFHGAIMGG